MLLHVLLLQTLVVHLVRNVAALTDLLHGGGCRRRDGKVAIRRLWKGNHTGIPVVDSGHSRNRMNSMVGNHRMWIAAASGNHTNLLLSRHLYLYLRELSECRLVLLLLLLLLLHLKGFGFRDGLAVLICLELQQATGHGGSVAARPLSLLLRDLLLLLLLVLLLLILLLLLLLLLKMLMLLVMLLVLLMMLIISLLLLLLSVLKLSLGKIGKHSWIDALWYRHVSMDSNSVK